MLAFMRKIFLVALLASGAAAAQSGPGDTDEAAYTPSTLAKIMGGSARSQNDEAELAGPGQWFTTVSSHCQRLGQQPWPG